MNPTFVDRSTIDLSNIVLKSLTKVGAPRKLRRREADLSQQGEERLRLANEARMELSDGYYVLMDAVPGDLPSTELHGAIETVAIYVQCRIEDQLTHQSIAELQEALCPNDSPSTAAIINHPRVQRMYEVKNATSEATNSELARIVTNQARENATLAALMNHAVDGIEEDDTATVAAGNRADRAVRVMRGSYFDQIDDSVLSDIFSHLGDLSAPEQAIYDDYRFVGYLAPHMTKAGIPAEECDVIFAWLSHLPSYQSVLRDAAVDLNAKAFVMPPGIRSALELANFFKTCEVLVMTLGEESSYRAEPLDKPTQDEQDALDHRKQIASEIVVANTRSNLDPSIHAFGANVTVPIARAMEAVGASTQRVVYTATLLKKHDCGPYAELAFALLQSMKVRTPGATTRQKMHFGCARAAIVRLGLYIDSKEIVRIPGLMHPDTPELTEFYASQELVDMALKLLIDPEEIDIYLICALISFLKSGHHATAAGMPATTGSVIGAMGVTIARDEATIKMLAPYSTYFGFHPGSTRLFYAINLDKAAKGELSYAISRRLFVTSPGNVSIVTAMIFLRALARAKFFDVIHRSTEFASLEVSFENWIKTAKYASVYSQYLYGRTVAEDTAFKSSFASWMPYCAAIPTVMPTGSLKFSAALSRDSAAAASNDIIGPMFATAFGTGIASAASRSVRAAIESGTLKLI